LSALARAAFPRLTIVGRTALDAVIDAVEGSDPDAFGDTVESARHLTTMLRSDGLPGARELAGWLRVIHWTLEWEIQGTSLCTQALVSGAAPANWYRTVRLRTGRTWSEVKALGSGWLLAVLIRRCVPPGRSSRAAGPSESVAGAG
jgi:hypothetical protein